MVVLRTVKNVLIPVDIAGEVIIAGHIRCKGAHSAAQPREHAEGGRPPTPQLPA
eukprot:SAG11_NODE_25847_length_353_cov_0.775591_1_plen_53_part_10